MALLPEELAMRDVFWIPREDTSPTGRRPMERPYLEAPSPFAMPWEPPRTERAEDDDEDSPRVIVIDI